VIFDFISYKVKIRDTEFVTPDGVKYSNTAAISFFDKNKKELSYIELGYIDSSAVYDKIKNNLSVNIDYCYIEEFSLSKYRKISNLDIEELISIKSFSAKNSIFDSL